MSPLSHEAPTIEPVTADPPLKLATAGPSSAAEQSPKPCAPDSAISELPSSDVPINGSVVSDPTPVEVAGGPSEQLIALPEWNPPSCDPAVTELAETDPPPSSEEPPVLIEPGTSLLELPSSGIISI